MHLRRTAPALAGALALLATPAAASAAKAPTSLPSVVKTVKAATTTGTACAAARDGAAGRGARYTAPISGYLTVGLRGSGDWDLALRTATGRRVGASQGTTGRELVKTWIGAGQTVVAVPCKRRGATGSARISFDLLDVAPRKQVGPTQLVKVTANREQKEALESGGFDVTHDVTSSTANVLVNGTAEIKALLKTGLEQKVVIKDLAARDRRDRVADRDATLKAKKLRTRAAGLRAGSLPSGRTEYRTYESIQAELKDLAEQHPTMVKPISIGMSFEGRDVMGVEIANDVKATDGRPAFFLMGVHHAREWPAAEAVMEYAQLLVKMKDDPTYKAILDKTRVVLVPLVNPDGYVVSRSAISPGDEIGGDENVTLVEAVAPPGGFGAYRRKNCNPVLLPAGTPCESAIGVDNNRNYGNLWGGPGGSPDLTSQAFHGLEPRSEPETQNVWNYVRTHHVTMLISMHTVGALVLRPPGLAQLGLAPDEVRMKEVGDAMAAAAGYPSQYSWQLYDTAGTTEDDTYAATGGYGYTFEMGPADGGFHGAYQGNVIDQWTGDYAPAMGGGGLKKSFTIASEVAGNGADHAIFKGTAPAGKVLRLKKSFDTVTSEYCEVGIEPVIDPGLPISQACPEGIQQPITLKDTVDTTTTVPAGGSFEWHIGQSTRPFVGGGATLFTFEDVALGTLSDGPGAPSTSEYDLPFTVPAGGLNRVDIDLTSTSPADAWGLDLKRKNADGTFTSIERHNYVDSPGEQITLAPAEAGEYVVTAYNFAAATPFTMTVTGRKGIPTITTGRTEAYTLTCEEPDGKVLETRELTIGRGQSITAEMGCGVKPTTVGPPVTQPGATPVPGAATPPTAPAAAKFSSSAAVDFTSIKRATREGLRVRVKGTGPYSAVITLLDAKNKRIARRTLAKLTGRKTVRIKAKRIAQVRTVKVTITETATKKAKTYTIKRAVKKAAAKKRK